MKKREIRNILVIRFRRVGDSVLAMALCGSLKRTFPQANVDFIMDDNISSLYQNHPDIHKLITFTKDESGHLFKYLGKIRRIVRETHYDVIIDMRSTIRTSFFSLYSLSTPYRIGRKKWYTRFIHNYRIQKDESLNRVKQNLALMQPLAKEADLVLDEHFRLYISDAENVGYAAYMEKQGIDFHRPVVLATVTARLMKKVWNPERMKEVLRRIIAEYNDVQIIFNYAGEVEEENARRMYEEMGSDAHIFINVKAKSLRELCALCKNSTFFFGNEGGPRHIAQAMGLPSYAIFSPGIRKNLWLPADSDDYQGISPDDILAVEKQKDMDFTQCLDLIQPDDVWQGLNPMLKRILKR